MMAFSRLSARARSVSKPCGRSGVVACGRHHIHGPVVERGGRRQGRDTGECLHGVGHVRPVEGLGGLGERVPRLPVEEMVRRVGIGFVRLEQALERPVVHGRGDEPLCGCGVRAEPVGQGQLLGHGVDLVGGQVLAEQSRRLQVVGGAVVVDADDDADTVTVRHRAVEHCESLHAGHSSFGRRVSAFAETYYILGVSAGAWRLS